MPEQAGTLKEPKWTGPMAKTYPFTLDPFQNVSVACIVRSLHPDATGARSTLHQALSGR